MNAQRLFFVAVLLASVGCKQKDPAPAPEPGATSPAAQLTIEPGVGVGDLKFGMTRQEMVDVLGEPDREMGMAREYLDKGMAVLGGPSTDVAAILFGDMNSADSPLVKACRFRTDKGIGMGSTRNEILAAYGQPTGTRKSGPPREEIKYRDLGATFSLIDGKVAHMSFRKTTPTAP